MGGKILVTLRLLKSERRILLLVGSTDTRILRFTRFVGYFSSTLLRTGSVSMTKLVSLSVTIEKLFSASRNSLERATKDALDDALEIGVDSGNVLAEGKTADGYLPVSVK